ncbi:hypothetical protein JCM1841_004598 [Sporobolomyces salmonicolor]
MASPRRVAVSLLLLPPSPAAPDPSEPSFLLISSRKRKDPHGARFVFPKGGVEHGESSRQAAERESWEEAGLVPGAAQHLTHLVTNFDPSPHILSPSADADSPSFVSACRYEFELFLLPPFADPDVLLLAAPRPSPSPSTASSNPSSTSSSSSALSSAGAAAPAPAAAAAAPPPLASACVSPLSPTWPEAHERTRRVVHGWSELEEAVCWGRREGVMRQAVEAAKAWLEEWDRNGRRIEREEEG